MAIAPPGKAHQAPFIMKRRIPLLIAGAALLLLALTNPDEADFREHVRSRQGIVGTLGLAAADLLSGGGSGGIKRDNYFLASRFYVGGNGTLPREDLAWGFAGRFHEVSPRLKEGILESARPRH